MKKTMKASINVEGIILIMLLVGLVASAMVLVHRSTQRRQLLASRAWLQPGQIHGVVEQDFQALEASAHAGDHPEQADGTGIGLLVGELRVVAIGSAYPIPYDAEVCPFTGTPQPAMNQLDRDADGMTDDWEIKFGLDKYNTADASEDADGDGFINLEEFCADTDPTSLESHPPYATKLRFVRRMDVPFPLIFQGVSDLPDGRKVFQLNTPSDGKTHFRALGEEVDGIVPKRFIPRGEAGVDTLVVLRGSVEIRLPRGEKVPDPESRAELINILDRSTEIVNMGALLSLRNDEYTVLGVYRDKVAVRHRKTGEVFEIVGFADGEREALSRGFKE